MDILAKPTAKESAKIEQFRTAGGSAIREHCPHLTKEECRRWGGRAGGRARGEWAGGRVRVRTLNEGIEWMDGLVNEGLVNEGIGWMVWCGAVGWGGGGLLPSHVRMAPACAHVCMRACVYVLCALLPMQAWLRCAAHVHDSPTATRQADRGS